MYNYRLLFIYFSEISSLSYLYLCLILSFIITCIFSDPFPYHFLFIFCSLPVAIFVAKNYRPPCVLVTFSMFKILKQGDFRYYPIEPLHTCTQTDPSNRQDLRGVRSDIKFKIKQMVHKKMNIQAQDVQKWLDVEYSDLHLSWKPSRSKISAILEAEKKRKNINLRNTAIKILMIIHFQLIQIYVL